MQGKAWTDPWHDESHAQKQVGALARGRGVTLRRGVGTGWSTKGQRGNAPQAPWAEVARLFLKLGTLAFGGPAAHIA